MFDRDPKTKISDPAGPKHYTVFPEQHSDNTQLQHQDAVAKIKMKEYKDTRNHATLSDIKTGDFVPPKQQKQNKLNTPFNSTPMTVTDTKGPMVTAQSTAHPPTIVTRNSSQYHKLKYPQSTSIQDMQLLPEVISDSQAVPDTGMIELLMMMLLIKQNRFSNPLPRKHHHPPQTQSEDHPSSQTPSIPSELVELNLKSSR